MRNTAPVKLLRGCMVCGAPLEYSTEEREIRYEYCRAGFVSSAVCAAGHFVCDACHAEDAAELSRDLLPVTLRAEAPLDCGQAGANEECIGAACPLFGAAAPAPRPLRPR